MKIETFKTALKVKIASELINNVDERLSVQLNDIITIFDAQVMEWVSACLVELKIDPQILYNQTRVIRELTQENKMLKKENEMLYNENMRWKYIFEETMKLPTKIN